IVSARQGLVLVVGVAGSGKSTTLASLVDHINSHFFKAIFTIEQPVEFVHKHCRSLIEQNNYAWGTRLQDLVPRLFLPSIDVLVLDGLDKKEVISWGLDAAAKGVLVLASLETNGGIAETIKLIVELFPASAQESVRGLLARTLRAVVWQHLFPLR